MYRGERFNSITHLVGAFFALVGGAVLVTLAAIDGEVAKIISYSVYATTLFLLYLASTLYHSLPGRAKNLFRVLLYLVMGWMCVFVFDDFVHALSAASLAWMIAGGIFYTSGVVFFVLDNWYPWCHGIWHLFVIAGSTCHYISILLL